MAEYYTETREEYMAWAKSRALEYVDRGNLPAAVASMLSDLGKRVDTTLRGAGPFIGAAGMLAIEQGPEAVRHWVEGFN